MAETLYSVSEIGLATGMKKGTIRSRRIRLGIPPNRKGYTYLQVQQLIRVPKRWNTPSRRRADELKNKLKNDGFAAEVKGK